MNKGRSIELFFHNGTPGGMTTVTIPFQWTGHVLVTGRTQLNEALKESETGQPGIYLLVGDREGRETLYIGETDEIRTRLKQHANTDNKDWWETAIFVTASGEPLNKAHARYLESKIYCIARDVGKVALANKNVPVQSPLSKAAQAHMNNFLENLRLILPALRFDFLTENTEAEKIDNTKNVDDIVYFTFDIQKHNIRARARLEQSTGRFIVRKGSLARSNWVGSNTSTSSYSELHAELLETNVLMKTNGNCEFSRDYVFRSSSAAAAVVSGRSASGPASWVQEGTNLKLGDWEKQQLDAS